MRIDRGSIGSYHPDQLGMGAAASSAPIAQGACLGQVQHVVRQFHPVRLDP